MRITIDLVIIPIVQILRYRTIADLIIFLTKNKKDILTEYMFCSILNVVM